jgi:hypothetical protein
MCKIVALYRYRSVNLFTRFQVNVLYRNQLDSEGARRVVTCSVLDVEAWIENQATPPCYFSPLRFGESGRS